MRYLKVLLVGRGFETAITTLSHLAECGCRYQCAGSLFEADRLVREQTFDLVLNAIYADSHNVCSLRDALRGAPTTLLYSYEVDEGFWWILGLDRGRPCVGEAPAIPQIEFPRVLDLVLAELRANGTVLPRMLTWFSSREPRLHEAISSRTEGLQTRALRAVAS
jgi:hypothetical protein